MTPTLDWSLSQAQDWLRQRLDSGEKCPLCHQKAKVYKRLINTGMAKALIKMYQTDPVGFMHKPTVLKGYGPNARDESLLRFWGLIEEELTVRKDGGRSGWWRVTPAGGAFVRGNLTVPKYARIYDSHCLGLTGDPVSIHDCLDSPFDLEQLLAH